MTCMILILMLSERVQCSDHLRNTLWKQLYLHVLRHVSLGNLVKSTAVLILFQGKEDDENMRENAQFYKNELKFYPDGERWVYCLPEEKIQ